MKLKQTKESLATPNTGLGSVNVQVEGDGISGKAATYSVLGALVAGLVIGSCGSYQLFKFEPSEEYLESQAELEITRTVISDSLRNARIATEVAEREAQEALAEVAQLQDIRDEIAQDAEQFQQQADSLRDLRGDTEDAGLLVDENTFLRAALTKRDEELEVVGQAFSRASLAVAALQRVGREQHLQLQLQTSQIASLERALTIANREIARATNRIRSNWYTPKITIGAGCSFHVSGEGGFGCGPAVTVGVSVNPFQFF